MSKNLVIVESPAKAKTIEGYLGKDFVVKSSYGHVRDLPKSDVAIDVANNFEPVYEISEDKKDVVAELIKAAKKAETVWLATDEDREGEAISWHLAEALGLPIANTKRIVFHEITKSAIQKAIENPRTIDIDLVNAQQARRVLDRLVGFELSPVLWKKVRQGLSAGRVQSVAVRIIVEREREIDQFKTSSFYNVRGNFDLGTAILKADLARRLSTSEEAFDFLSKCKGAEFSISNIETKPAKRTPAAPFTTSTLQQEAGRKLGFSVSRTMVVAQKLYESGKITYMRTDSVNLSDFALDAAKNEITTSYGSQYSKTRQFTSKSKGAQEAHEAIRPTEMSVHEVAGDASEQRLYDLIWKRTLASQMADAELEKTTATVSISTMQDVLLAKGEVIKFDGFLKVYMEGSDDEVEEENSGLLPPLTIGQKLALAEIISTQRFTQKPARYTEASLVKRLEELGIGRPSTYAPTISTIQQREYIEKKDKEGISRKYEVLTLDGPAHKGAATSSSPLERAVVRSEEKTEMTGAEKSKLFPTDIGIVVNDFLVDQFPRILDFGFTAAVEAEFDDIAEGKLSWQEMMTRFYFPFHKNVEETLESASRQSGERDLGVDPVSGKNVIVRIARFGPVVQIGASDDEKKKFASLRKEQSIGTITLEEALKLFELPRTLGEWQGQSISAGLGRFGPFVKWGTTYASLKPKEGDDPYTIETDRAIRLLEDKINGVIANEIQKFDSHPDVKVIKGRFGPYIKSGSENYKLPKGADPEKISIEEILAAMAEQDLLPKKEKRGRFGKKAAVKKAPVKKAARKKKPE
ncbi:MAG: type I DNA topoisomerase [Flavobacteriales bacterium]|nr:type I DNA topoisomerase [Flavobacteriales bacterium]